MRFHVFEPETQLNSQPDHNCSRSKAKLAVSMKLARQIGQNAIQLIALNWREVKKRLNGDFSHPAYVRAYEHHLEPRIEEMTLSNSPWLRYLHGWE